MADYEALPGVDALVRHAEANGGGDAMRNAGHATAVQLARDVVEEERDRVRRGVAARPIAELADVLVERVSAHARPSLRRVINATGVILQTNLGRAPLSDAAIAAMAQAAAGYTNLEYDIEQGARGSRHEHVRDLLRQATGAEDGIVVNNNAAALFMALQVFASGREVVVSRGQAVEIGGGFRIPDVLRQSGAGLVEVGTTNRTYARDYEAAIGADSAAILRVHTSNFRVVGFTATPTVTELVGVAHRAGILLIDDLGSGCLLPTERWGMAHEPTVQESLQAGCDLVLFSGDKLLGGPQAGIIVGRSVLVERLRRHPLARALRVDKLTIAALNATLAAYVRGTAETEVPVWRMVALTPTHLRPRAAVYAAAADGGQVTEGRSMVGGGSLPGEGLEGPVATFTRSEANALAAKLRRLDPPIIARVDDGKLTLDPRTVAPADDQYVVESLGSVVDSV
jgi:L-seryl-tRNA(Ser) seleniumtransferase